MRHEEPTTPWVKWRELDLDALRHNYGLVRREVGPDKHIIASVKGNAYGHGIVPIVRVLDDLGVYAVATGSIEDARAIRAAGLKTRLQMFACAAPEGIDELLALDVSPTIHNLPIAEAVSRRAAKSTLVYVKVDSGLGRLGVPIEEAPALIEAVARLPRIRLEGIYTHAPFSNPAGREWARQCIERFEGLLAELARRGIEAPVVQASASAAIAAGIVDSCTAVCPGHLLYGGLSRVTPDVGDLSRYRPVLKAIKCRIIHIGPQAAGKPIGINGSLVLPSDCVVGVVPFGMADGYRAPVAGRAAEVLVRQRRARVLGINLEYSMLNLSGINGVELGEEVIVLGGAGDDQVTLEEIAGWQGAPILETLMSFDKPLPTRLCPPGEASCRAAPSRDRCRAGSEREPVAG